VKQETFENKQARR